MNKLVLIFDYFKEAFHTNKKNKALYKPQIAIIGLRVLLILLVGIGIYNWIGIDNIYAAANMRPAEIFGFLLGLGLKLILIILAYSVITVLIESGLLNMYKKAVTQGYTEAGDFKEGLSKYFVKLLLGELLIIICYILSLPFYLLLGVVTLTVGLTVIPLAAGVFLTMWKISLVMNDIGIIAAIKDSFSFAKRNFLPLAVLQVIHWSFTKGPGGGGGGGGSYNFPSGNNFSNQFDNSFLPMDEIVNMMVSVFKVMVAILIPVVAVATIGASIIGMIFEVFFTLALFVAYKNGFRVEEFQLEAQLSMTITEEVPEKAPLAEVSEETLDEVHEDSTEASSEIQEENDEEV